MPIFCYRIQQGFGPQEGCFQLCKHHQIATIRPYHGDHGRVVDEERQERRDGEQVEDGEPKLWFSLKN